MIGDKGGNGLAARNGHFASFYLHLPKHPTLLAYLSLLAADVAPGVVGDPGAPGAIRASDPAKRELDPTVLCDEARGCPIGISGATGRS